MQYLSRTIPKPQEDALIGTGYHPVLARILASRGVNQSDCDMSLAGLIPPHELKGLDTVCQYLAAAIATNKRATIVADYDCDGATACAIGIRGLRMLGLDVDFLVPNRFKDGYGLTPNIVDQVLALDRKTDFIITVDNGIASIDGVAYAHQHHLDVVITDHHLAGEQIPDTNLIVNPNQPGCRFPSKSLAGCGVMFYVLLGLRALLRDKGAFTRQDQPKIESLLDLVALGTIADVVSLDKNNRILVTAGLKQIRTGYAQAGVEAIYQAAGRQSVSTVSMDLGFFIGPRLNAAGRIADMALGIKCLIEDDFSKAMEIASELQKLNTERRSIESEIQSDADIALDNFDPKHQYTICLAQDHWHEGVIGIVAGRLKEAHHRPTIVFALSEGHEPPILKGSGRSIPGFHLRDALDLVSKRNPELIKKFGGHAMAAGLTIAQHQFDLFVSEFEKVAQDWLTPEILTKTIYTDGELADEDIGLTLYSALREQVWGQNFPEPLFIGEFIVDEWKVLADKHLKLKLRNAKFSAQKFDAIWFKNNKAPEQKMSLAYKLSENNFRGESTLQLMIEGEL